MMAVFLVLAAASATLASSCGGGACLAIGCGSSLSLGLDLPVSLERASSSALTMCQNGQCQRATFVVTGQGGPGLPPTQLSVGIAPTGSAPAWAGIASQGPSGRPALRLTWRAPEDRDGDRYRVVLIEPDGKETVLFDEPVTFRRSHPLDMECTPLCPSAQFDRVTL
jgi:hypothetical protein